LKGTYKGVRQNSKVKVVKVVKKEKKADLQG
jgi:hypothetical protein